MVRVLFVHPDLGIGGAERLVIDAALALQNKGHEVSFLTNHHDPNHCFEETRNGQLIVRTVGDWIPRTIFGKFYALCAYIRMIYAAFYTVFVITKTQKIDVIFCDQISLGIPIFKLAKERPRILFYCHFPDQLLSKPGTTIKQFYRIPLNYLEELTTGQADGILVNSKFTRRVFKETFRSLDIIPDVLHPSLNTKYFDDTKTDKTSLPVNIADDTFVFLSVNRFERKKNLTLLLTSFKLLPNSLSKSEWDKTHLIIAGGYDYRVPENVEHFDELNCLAKELDLETKVTFLQSPNDVQKLALLRRCEILLYTPENEHFGIVPLEGMYLSKPVVAINSGGPMETIINESTGFLCNPDREDFARNMIKFIKDRSLIPKMGEMGHKRVKAKFSFESFTDNLEHIITTLIIRSNSNLTEQKTK